MGQVYLARDTLLDRLVAVKFIATPEGREPDPGSRARFFQEARAIARLQHPNVVAIHRVGEVRRQPYLVSEFIRGESLDRLSKPVDGKQALRIAIGLARGLAAAHRCGVLHRDIKPANAVLSEDGEVKLVDFGLAELLESDPGDVLAVPAPPGAGEAPAGPRDTLPPLQPGPSDTGPGDEARETRRLRQAGAESSPQPEPSPAATRRLQGVGPGAALQGPLDLRETHQLHGVALAGAPPEASELTGTQPRNAAASARAAQGEAETRRSPGPLAGISGTPLYRAPELWRGESPSRVSDI
jgi:serine/threonine protein kinase